MLRSISCSALRRFVHGAAQRAPSEGFQSAVLALQQDLAPGAAWLCRTVTSSCACCSSSVDEEPEAPATSRVMVNRLLYRSRQRGFLEMDLLVGQFAERRLPQMSESELAAFSSVLDQENPDLFKWLTGQDAPSDAMQKNSTFKELREHVQAQLAAHCAPGAASVSGKAWVRGWDDSEKPTGRAPQAG